MLLVALVKLAVPHLPLAACRDQVHGSLVHEKSGQRVSCRRGVDDISTERAAVLIGDSAGPRGRANQKRKLASDDFVLPQVGVGTAGTNTNLVGQDFDPAELGKI